MKWPHSTNWTLDGATWSGLRPPIQGSISWHFPFKAAKLDQNFIYAFPVDIHEDVKTGKFFPKNCGLFHIMWATSTNEMEARMIFIIYVVYTIYATLFWSSRPPIQGRHSLGLCPPEATRIHVRPIEMNFSYK